jgi:Protein of unknown function (DUF2865)
VGSGHWGRCNHLAARIAARGLVIAGLAAAANIFFCGSAQAQGFFEALFGRRWSGPHAYADPNSQAPETARPESSGSVVYCVRLCDGRFFPIQRHAGINPAEACSAFCPASRTRIFHGGSIEHAVTPDGKRYADLSSAFVYREKIVPDCTCNGKDALGVVNASLEEDATLRPGDIVATDTGLMAYNGGAKRLSSNFTPIETYAGVSAELRRRLTETKITPAAPAPEARPRTEPGDDKTLDRTGRNPRNRRVQVER